MRDVGRKGGYLVRSTRIMLTHPLEGFDRVRNRLELKRWGHRDYAYDTDASWEERLHHALRAEWPCPEHETFAELWTRIGDRIGGFRHGHDADPAAARASYCITRHLRPEVVVETGVARGISSSVVLEGLATEERGRLWSIDFPPTLEGWHRQVGIAVPISARERWVYLRGSTRRRLPQLLEVLGSVDFCVLASSLTEPTREFETTQGWQRLRGGGFLLSEGVNRSRSFLRLMQRPDVELALLGCCEAKPEVFGIAMKRDAGRE